LIGYEYLFTEMEIEQKFKYIILIIKITHRIRKKLTDKTASIFDDFIIMFLLKYSNNLKFNPLAFIKNIKNIFFYFLFNIIKCTYLMYSFFLRWSNYQIFN